VIDAIRCAKIALDNGISGALLGPCAYLKKSPPVQYDDNTARAMMENFIDTYGKKKRKKI
jgi:myo-inositol-1-phosphate synthase